MNVRQQIAQIEERLRRRKERIGVCTTEVSSGEGEMLLQTIKTLENALDPFIRLADMLEPLNLSDDRPIRDCAPGVWPTLGDCRKARAALASIDKEQ